MRAFTASEKQRNEGRGSEALDDTPVAAQAPAVAPAVAPTVAPAVARVDRGWPYFEELCSGLFKDAAALKPLKLPTGEVLPPWRKLVDVAAEADKASLVGAAWEVCEDEVEYEPLELRKVPPVAAMDFEKTLATKRFAVEADRAVVAHIYRQVLEDGFNGQLVPPPLLLVNPCSSC